METRRVTCPSVTESLYEPPGIADTYIGRTK